MRRVVHWLLPSQIRWQALVYESLLLLAGYSLWLIFWPANPSGRNLVGGLSVLAPLVASVFIVLRSLSQFSSLYRRSWFFLALALGCLAISNLIRLIYLADIGQTLPSVSSADFFDLLTYPLIFLALIVSPFENRYAPSRFRFFLDVAISSGAIATLGWLVLAPSLGIDLGANPKAVIPSLYPILDLSVLIILINTLLANRKFRRTSLLWTLSLTLILVSDYIYAFQVSFQAFQFGQLSNLGWTIGFMLFGIGALVEIEVPGRPARQKGPQAVDRGASLQNLVPVTLVLVLFWYVLMDWELRGRSSAFGLFMSLLLSLGLIVRMGIRAGESELQKYWQLFSSLADPAFICDLSGRIILGNPALFRATGLPEENQVIGQSLGTFFVLSAEPIDLLRQAAGQAAVREVHLQNTAAPYLLSLSPIASEGRKRFIAGVAHDLSVQKAQQDAIQRAYEELQVVYQQLEELNTQLEQKVEERTSTLSEANRQLEEQNKMLQALDQLKSDFVSLVSHELRTPLTSLTGGLELLLRRKNRTPSDQSTLLLMKNEIERLTRFVENILNLSAMDAGRMELHPRSLDLEAALVEVRAKLANLPGSQRIQVELDRDLPRVVADPIVLQSIFNHLIDNALKYAPDGPVRIEACCERRRVRVAVTDTGPGIPKEKRRLLFQRFQRLDARDSQSVYGYGLGLYLSRRLLQAMASDLAYEAPENGGSRFFFYLKAEK